MVKINTYPAVDGMFRIRYNGTQWISYLPNVSPLLHSCRHARKRARKSRHSTTRVAQYNVCSDQHVCRLKPVRCEAPGSKIKIIEKNKEMAQCGLTSFGVKIPPSLEKITANNNNL